MTAATDPGSTVAARICLQARRTRHAAAVRRSGPSVAAVAVGIGNPVHLGRERAEPLLVRHHLGGERHGEVGAAVESVLEAENRLSPGEVARHLHRVLDRLGAAVDEEGALLVGAGRHAVEPFGELDVGLVRGHRETHVGEPVELLADRLDHAGVPVTGVDHADAAAEVDEAVAVGVGQDGSLGVDDGDRRHGWDASGDRLRAASQEGAAVGAGDLGVQMDDAGHDGPRRGSAWDASSRACERGTHRRTPRSPTRVTRVP